MKRNSKGKQEMTETTAEDRSAELLPETTEIIMRLTGEISEHLFNNLADFARHLATTATDYQIAEPIVRHHRSFQWDLGQQCPSIWVEQHRVCACQALHKRVAETRRPVEER